MPLVYRVFRSFIVDKKDMKRLLLSLTLLLGLFSARAYHIVGGEIEFIYLSDGLYRINLIMYIDQVQEGNPNGFLTPPNNAVNVFMFRNGDNVLVNNFVLPLTLTEPVFYTNIECARDELETMRAFYTLDVEMDPALFDNPSGYYLQWERCCRNTRINNIISPSNTGMNYVLEIPPLMKDGQVFVNSSPQLFKPLSDYACINQLYYVEFTGVDPDGDSLVYSLATPLNSSSVNPLPVPQPKPHFGVTFRSDYSVDNMVRGSPPLRISNKGLLTVNPSETGLYVFSVMVEEYRDKVKIGEVRRDFQLLVVDGCNPPDPPVVDIDIPGNPGFDASTDVLNYTVSDAKCFDFLVSNITPGETISLRAEGVNFNEDLDEIFSLNQIPVDGSASELQIEVCIPNCPPIRDEPFILDLIAADDACPLPQLDTLRLVINVQPPPNESPTFSTTSSVLNIVEDSFHSQTITGNDVDGEDLSMTLWIEGLEDPAEFGFDLTITNTAAGSIEGDFTWDTNCLLYDYAERQQFNVAIIIDDSDECDVPPADTLFIDANVILPPNTDPFITLDAALPGEVELGSAIDVNVTATDNDGDDVSLRFVGGNFSPVFYNVLFEDIEGSGSVSSNFLWNIPCTTSIFDDGEVFELLFIADDDDKCKVKNFDTLRHLVTVRFPANVEPAFEPIETFQSLRVNEGVQIPIEAFDNDGEEITLQFATGFRQPSSPSLTFEPVTGNGRAIGVLEWQPECTLLRFGETSSMVDVIVEVSDNACPTPNVETLKLTFEIFDDGERRESFLPPNVFTPNGDGLNDTFTLSGHLDVNQNLPPDNCDNTFEYILISNRAGSSVFRSSDRDFVWSGGQFPAGVYYYVVKYSNTEFKGYVHLIR